MPTKRIAERLRRQARRWRPNPAGLAAVAAARGDPLPLLALETHELHDEAGQKRDGSARRRDAMPDSTRG